MNQGFRGCYVFGEFRLDGAERRLLRHGAPISLPPKILDTLLLLVENASHLVEKDEFMKQLWPGTFVGEDALARNISILRKTLGESGDSQSFIATVPTRGYRFVATVQEVNESEPRVAEAQSSKATGVLEGTAATKEEARMQGQRQQGAATIGSGVAVSREPPVAPAPANLRSWLRRIAFVALVLGVGSVAGMVTFHLLSRSKGPSLQGIRMTKLTHSGAVTGVAISPDGRYVAYAKLEGDKQGLWLRQIAAQSDVPILPPGTGFHGLTFSPDGNYLYFVRSDENDTMFKYLYSMPALGGPVKKLFTDVDSPVSFSPDGHRFVYEHCVEGRDDIELKMASIDGGDDHVLAVIHNATSLLFQPGPNWSPDGRTIAVPLMRAGLRSEWRWALDVVEVSNGSIREIFSSPRDIGRPVWLQADSLLVPLYDAFTSRGQLWTISYPEGKVQRFTNDLTSYGSNLDDYGFPLDRSRDGNSLVALAVTQRAKVWMAPAAAPWEAKQLTNSELPIVSAAEASDGKLWAATGDGQLWIMNPDGSQASPYGDYHDIGTIAGCGRFMVFRLGETGARLLTRLDVDGRHPTDLVTGNVFGPFCSPDGKFVFYTSGQQPQKIWRVPIQGGAPVEIAEILGDEITGGPSISPDGSLIAYVYTKFGPALGPSLAVIPSTGGPPIKSMPVQAENWVLSWSPDGTGIQYLMNRNGVTNIWEQPLSGGKPKQVTRFTSDLIFDFSWSFDRKHLLLTRGEISSDAVLLSHLH